MAQYSFEDLFREVVALTKNSKEVHEVEVHPTLVLCSRVAQVQDKLKQELFEKIPECVRCAAGKGKNAADILTFTGNEKYDDDFSYLFLLKGPRDREQKYDLHRHGFNPLIDILSREVNPFEVTFTWVPGCNMNKVTVSW